MRPSVLGALFLLLTGCIVYGRHPYPAQPGPEPSGPARRIISQEEAVEQAFRLCQDRELRVDRVERANLDSTGRWHVTLAGYLDRAQMLLDGRDGRLLARSVPPRRGTSLHHAAVAADRGSAAAVEGAARAAAAAAGGAG